MGELEQALEQFVQGVIRAAIAELQDNPTAFMTPYLRINDVCRLLRVGRSTVDRALAAGTFEPAPVEKHPYRWLREDVWAHMHRKPKT